MKATILLFLGLISAKQLHKNGGDHDGTIVAVPIQSLVSKASTARSTYKADDEDYGYAAGEVDTEDYIAGSPIPVD